MNGKVPNNTTVFTPVESTTPALVPQLILEALFDSRSDPVMVRLPVRRMPAPSYRSKWLILELKSK